MISSLVNSDGSLARNLTSRFGFIDIFAFIVFLLYVSIVSKYTKKIHYEKNILFTFKVKRTKYKKK